MSDIYEPIASATYIRTVLKGNTSRTRTIKFTHSQKISRWDLFRIFSTDVSQLDLKKDEPKNGTFIYQFQSIIAAHIE